MFDDIDNARVWAYNQWMLNQHEITAEILKSMRGAIGKILGLSHPNEIDDCMQDSIVRILSAVDSFDSERGNFKTWCSTLDSNTAKNWRKASINNGHESTTIVGDDADESEAESTLDSLVGEDGVAEVSRRSDMAWLATAIETLDDDARMFVTGITEGLGLSEAGALVGWSPATATRRYRTIVADLAIEMGL
jgi:RNA polymerase sigma factor (sigma-70 family)